MSFVIYFVILPYLSSRELAVEHIRKQKKNDTYVLKSLHLS